MLLEKDCINKILQVLEQFSFPRHGREDIICALASFIRKGPPPDWEKILHVLPLLNQVLSETNSQEVLENVFWSLYHISGIIFQFLADLKMS